MESGGASNAMGMCAIVCLMRCRTQTEAEVEMRVGVGQRQSSRRNALADLEVNCHVKAWDRCETAALAPSAAVGREGGFTSG